MENPPSIEELETETPEGTVVPDERPERRPERIMGTEEGTVVPSQVDLFRREGEGRQIITNLALWVFKQRAIKK